MSIQFKKINENQEFKARKEERYWLADLADHQTPCMVVTYGRRRVGKTELLEQAFKDRKILKFEGVEGQDQAAQRRLVMQQLADYTDNKLLRKLEIDNWLDVFMAIRDYVAEGTVTLYFEELQWLADYKDELISELKLAWDNYFRHNPKLLLILCGSSPSFMINQVLHSKALYNRSQHELHLEPFNFFEAQQLLPRRGLRELMDAYLTVGGIPEYLNRINKASSLFLGLCKNSFVKNGYLVNEYQRIFVSSLSNNPHYQKIIEYCAKNRFVTRKKIQKSLKLHSSGHLTNLLNDLELCGFIEKYTPYNLADNSLLARYAIKDNYLQFYYKFIQPIKSQIDSDQYKANPASALSRETYHKWLGFAFERWCRQNHAYIAGLLGFSAIHYKAGAFFNRATDKEHPGYQIDLLYERNDGVITLCEIRYHADKVDTSVITEVERKIKLLPNKKHASLHKVLISAQGASDALHARAYFDVIITLEDLINPQPRF